MNRLVLIAVVAILTSACRIDVDLSVDLTPTGAGDLAVRVQTDEEFEDLYRLTDREFEDFIATRGAELGLQFVVTEGPNTTTYEAHAAGIPAETLANLLGRLSPGLATVSISPTDNALELDADVAPLPEGDDYAPFFRDFDPAELAGSVDVNITVTVPGEADASTADSVTADGLHWVLPFSSESTQVFVRTILEPSEGTSIPWGAVFLTLVLVGGAVFLYLVRSRLRQLVSDEEPASLRLPHAPAAQEPRSIPPEDQPVAPPNPVDVFRSD